MSEFKGTPGPWVHHIASGYQHSRGGYILGSHGKICDVSGFDVGGEAAKENAKLITAAPELLEALQAMLNKAYKQNWNDQYPDEVEAAQAAIAKALGQ